MTHLENLLTATLKELGCEVHDARTADAPVAHYAVLVPLPNGTKGLLGLEFCDPRGSLSSEREIRLTILAELGEKVAVVKTVEDAAELLRVVVSLMSENIKHERNNRLNIDGSIFHERRRLS